MLFQTMCYFDKWRLTYSFQTHTSNGSRYILLFIDAFPKRPSYMKAVIQTNCLLKNKKSLNQHMDEQQKLSRPAQWLSFSNAFVTRMHKV